ncbi:hypothetical protein ACS0TY_006320 [Phlomoides rotata]
MARSNVPKFGTWENADVPYTVYFDKARKNRGGKMINPNENPEMFERSPLHQPKLVPVPGRRRAEEERSSSPLHQPKPVPGSRSRFRPVPVPVPVRGGDQSPEKGAAVPRFGEWNENDPQSAENFTAIFTKVRQERNTAAGTANVTPTPSYIRNQPSNKPKKCCCFPW